MKQAVTALAFAVLVAAPAHAQGGTQGNAAGGAKGTSPPASQPPTGNRFACAPTLNNLGRLHPLGHPNLSPPPEPWPPKYKETRLDLTMPFCVYQDAYGYQYAAPRLGLAQCRPARPANWKLPGDGTGACAATPGDCTVICLK